MRKQPKHHLPAQPADSLPLNIRQVLYVAAAILRRIGDKELAKGETGAIISVAQEPYGGQK